MKALVLFIELLALVYAEAPAAKVICYYDSKSYFRHFNARMRPSDLEPALSYCSYLVYGHAGIQPDTCKMVPLIEYLDTGRLRDNYRTIVNMAHMLPNLKVLLSVGGDADTEEEVKYKTLLESPQCRKVFVNSSVVLVKRYGFDGVDLAWQFPKIEPKKIRSTLGSFWYSVKKIFLATPVDNNASEHREGFTELVREMRSALNAVHPDMQLSVTILPNVNSSVYFDVPAIINLVDFVNIEAFDYYTPARNPKEADYASPIYAPPGRNPLQNMDSAVHYFLRSGVPAEKIIVGIPTVARTWRLDSDCGIAGVPPLHADGPGLAGPHTQSQGLLSYPEVCELINANHHKHMHHLRKVNESSDRFGTYAFHLPSNGESGLWVSYEDSDTAGQKANYVKTNKLGGVSIVDLSMDDFHGLCDGEKYPILRAANYRL